jgi:hypothetical protein
MISYLTNMPGVEVSFKNETNQKNYYLFYFSYTPPFMRRMAIFSQKLYPMIILGILLLILLVFNFDFLKEAF